jgi:hypothetical protein
VSAIPGEPAEFLRIDRRRRSLAAGLRCAEALRRQGYSGRLVPWAPRTGGRTTGLRSKEVLRGARDETACPAGTEALAALALDLRLGRP